MSFRNPENLHHLTGGINDWDDIPARELNRWQRIAKKTHGIVTAANAVSIAGFLLVMNGLSDIASGNKGVGLAKVVGGRALDVVDGEVAHRTGTKGNVGRVVDPTLDFGGLIISLPVMVEAKMIPLAAAATVATPKVATAIGSTIGFLRGQKTLVPEEAKIGTFGIWGGIAAFGVSAAFEKHIPGSAETVLNVTGWAGTVGGTVMQASATVDYIKTGFGAVETSKSPSV